MKHKKFILNKFRRKYVFLQNSLADFLHWRTFDYSDPKNALFFENFQKKNTQKVYLFAEDKISLQEYWKSSEQKKIANSIQNMNKEYNFSFFFKDKKTVKKENVFVKSHLYSSNEEKFTKKEPFEYFEKASFSKTTNTTSIMHFPFFSFAKKGQLLHKKRERKYSPLFEIKKRKFSLNYYFQNETLIPKSDCFRKVQDLPFFFNSKIGHFFPKKNHFSQYWIFPVLGFVILFSSPSSFFDFKKKTFSFQEKAPVHNIAEAKNPFNVLSIDFKENKNNQKTGLRFHSDRSSLKVNAPVFDVFSSGNRIKFIGFLNQNSLQNQQQKNSDGQLFQFAYSNALSREIYKQLIKQEKTEFQNICNFYLSFFKDSRWFFVDEKATEFFKKSSHFLNSNSCETDLLKQIIAMKRNIFHWNWYSLNPNFYTFEQKKKLSNVDFFNIPQKTQFFFSKNHKNEKFFLLPFYNSFSKASLLSKTTKTNSFLKKKDSFDFSKKQLPFRAKRNFSSNLTPAFDFTKARFIINEFERDLRVFPNSIDKALLPLSLLKENLSPVQMNKIQSQSFAHGFSKNHSFLFSFSNFPSLEEKKNSLRDEFETLKYGENTLQKLEKQDSQFQSQNIRFLEKWLQTQNFVKIKRNVLPEKISSKFFGSQQSSFLKDNTQKVSNYGLFPTKVFVDENTRSFFSIEGKNFHNKKLMNLDSLYLQKIFHFLTSLSNFSNGTTSCISKNFEEKFENIPFLKKPQPLSSSLKKHTFHFFVFDYYKKNSKNFRKPFFFHTNKRFYTFFPSFEKEKVFTNSSSFFATQNVAKNGKEKNLFHLNKRKAFFLFKNSKTNTKLHHSFSLKSFVFMRKILSFPSFFSSKNAACDNFVLKDRNSLNFPVSDLNKNFLFHKKTAEKLYFGSKNERSNCFFVETLFKKREASKQTVKVQQNVITNLEFPILFDFLQRKHFEENFISNRKNVFQDSESFAFNNFFLSKDLHFFNFSLNNLESHQSHQLSSYFGIQKNEVYSFFNFPNFSFSHIFRKGFFHNHTKTFEENKDKNLENGKEKIFEKNFSFSVSKTSFFEGFYKNTFKNLQSCVFWTQYKFPFFKKCFWLEKVKNEQPFVFKTHDFFVSKGKDLVFSEKSKSSTAIFQNFPIWNVNKDQSSFLFREKISPNKKSALFFSSPFLKKFSPIAKNLQDQNHKTSKNSSFFLTLPKSFVLKQKFFFSNQPKPYLETHLKKYKKDFSNFQSRKFEKIFQMFFSPLNKENIIFGVSLKDELTGQKMKRKEKNFFVPSKNLSQKSLQSKKAFFKVKIQKDSLLLQTLSTDLQVQLKISPLRFFLSFPSHRNQEKFLFKTKNESFLFKKVHPILFSKIQKNLQIFEKPTAFSKNKESIVPSFILKRNGFVVFPKSVVSKNFSTENEKEQNHSTFHQFTLSPFKKRETIKRLEKEKSLQKKRRLKKQKLETRRRKKRKRFFPRPLWLRFHLYKKFLKNRHPLKFSHSTLFKGIPRESEENYQDNSFSSFMNSSSFQNLTFFKSQNQFSKTKIYRKNRQKWGFYWKNGLQEKIVYKKFPQLNKNRNVLVNLHNSPISQNKEHYKISAEILSEFLRLSWKSYWFQTNVQPYTRQITENFKKMKVFESQKNLSDYKLFYFLANVSTTNVFSDFSQFKSNIIESSQNNFLLKKSLLKKFSWYCNIQSSLDTDSVARDLFFTNRPSSLNFQQIQNSPEYNRILYSRVSEILRNFKSSEFNDENFLRESQKNLKIPRHKNEPVLQNSSFSTKYALFSENFTIPSQPSLPAFSMFSSLFQNNSIKPTGELPTLRALWALHQTNFYHFLEKNSIRNLWTLQKRTNSLKSLKGTKQLVRSFQKYSRLEKLNVPKQLKPLVFNKFEENLPPLSSSASLFESEKKKHFFSNENFNNSLKSKDASFQMFSKKRKNSIFFPEKFAKKKYLFLSTLNSEFSDFIEQLDAVSLKKFRTVQQKCSVFGINTFTQNSKLSLRYLKFHLLSNPSKQNFSDSFHQDESSSKTSSLYFPFSFSKTYFPFDQQIANLTNNFTGKKSNPQNSAKSSLNFWWSQKNFIPFQFALSSQNKSLANFDVLQFSECFVSSSNKTKGLSFLSKENVQFLGLQSQLVFFAAILFHLALFFSLLKLPEIRNVLKFQCVLLYKFLNGFFAIVFSIYNLCEKYTTKGTIVAKKILQTCSTFSPRKDSKQFQLNILDSRELQIFAFKPISSTFPFCSSSFYSLSFAKEKVFARLKKRDQLQKIKRKHEKNSMNPFFATILRSSFQKKLQNNSFERKGLFQLNVEKNSNKKYLSPSKKYFSENFIFVPKNQMFFFKVSKDLFFDLFIRFSKFSYISSSEHSSSNSLFVLPLKSKKRGDQNILQALKKVQTLSISETFICNFALSFLLFGKSATLMSSTFVHFSSSFIAKILDFVEIVMFSLYKFLEKPAEFMIEWIALIFLIEWSSDIVTFVPDTLDIAFSKTSQKFYRPLRSGSLILSFFTKRNNLFLSSFSTSGTTLPFSFFHSLELFTASNMTSFVLQKRFLYFFENFSFVLTQPDMDIFVRQKKGMIFWDIWAEILLKAAEKYNVNIPSFVTLKEEQELFIERLLQDPLFLKNLQSHKRNGVFFVSSLLNNKLNAFQKTEQSVEILNSEMLQQKSLASFIENFLVKDRSLSFSNFVFFHQKKKIQQLSLFELLSFSTVDLNVSTKDKVSFFRPNNFISSLFFNSEQKNFVFEKLLVEKRNLQERKFLLQKRNENEIKGSTKYNLLQQKLSPFFKKSLWNKTFSENFFNDSFDFEKVSSFDRWSCHQYGTYQGPETDLFVDIHPPKSLKHIQFFKYYEPAQYTLGSFICQIYSGIFSRQVAKNILVIGSPGTAKTLLIQALAGETEMKMITDNAYRYSMVQRGVAVGMKYLRDVFDALALQTPCFFLMEHIHVIGSKRPLLISDDENVKGIQSSFGLDQQEVHETNQMIYQLNRHSITDYKRPYKGDFSMSIPTNFFLQNYYLNSEKTSSSIFKHSQFSAGGVNFIDRTSLTSPLPLESIEYSLMSQGLAEKEKTDTAFLNSFENRKKESFAFQSRLQRAKEQIFAPPATSPFTVLMIKEQKKLKPKKRVKENSWGGLSADQMISYQKENSSVRAKVAILADITMNLSRGKLDMITDLLVIIDSVRSNRGFVVFATTHLPSFLDPALRRPGRFDETISLAQSPNFLNRFEILKMHFENSLTTLDFLDSSILTENYSELNLLNFITATKLSFFHQYKYTSVVQKGTKLQILKARKKTLDAKFVQPNFVLKKRIFSKLNPSKAFQSFLKSSFFQDFYLKKKIHSQKNDQNTLLFSSFSNCSKNNFSEDLEGSNVYKEPQSFSSVFSNRNTVSEQSFQYFLRDSKLLKYTILPKGPSQILSLAYSKIGIFLAKASFANDPTAFIPLSLDTNIRSSLPKNQSVLQNTFYDSPKQQKSILMVFLAGKIAEFFIQKNTKVSFEVSRRSNDFCVQNVYGTKIQSFFTSSGQLEREKIEMPFELFSEKFSLFVPQRIHKTLNKQIFLRNQDRSTLSSHESQFNKNFPVFSQEKTNSSFVPKNDFFWTAFGNDSSWCLATPFLFTLVQKRFLFTKNLLLSKMLFFDNKNPRKQPPSPPSSSILMPSKKYENFKRTENDFAQKARFSINEKIQMHQQQRFLKQLYNIPIQEYFRSETIKNRKTPFNSSFQELAYLDSFTQRVSSSHFYQQKYLGIRHRFSNVHQWWNGFLPEHDSETTYLSDVDWRTMFGISSKMQKKIDQVPSSSQKQSEKSKFQTFEFTMDFPDAEQYYNPRNRRWYFCGQFKKNRFVFEEGKTGVLKSPENFAYWLTFDTTLQHEIYYHYLMQSFHETFKFLEKNCEMFDFFVFHLLRKGFLKELDYLTTISRFQNTKENF